MRTNGQSDHDTIKQPDVDLRASLSTFYEKQRTKEFPPLLKVAEQISSEVRSLFLEQIGESLIDANKCFVGRRDPING
jgi:hypothetical protein